MIKRKAAVKKPTLKLFSALALWDMQHYLSKMIKQMAFNASKPANFNDHMYWRENCIIYLKESALMNVITGILEL